MAHRPSPFIFSSFLPFALCLLIFDFLEMPSVVPDAQLRIAKGG
jgi:hypothetical protein